MFRKLVTPIILVAVLMSSCGYAVVKQTTPIEPQISQQEPKSISVEQFLANPDKGSAYPQIPVVGYLYQPNIEKGENMYVRQADGLYHVFEYTVAGKIRVEPIQPMIDEVEVEE